MRKLAGLQSDLAATEDSNQSGRTDMYLIMNGVQGSLIPQLNRRRGGRATRDPSVQQAPVKKSLHDIKLAYSEFYLGLVLLQNYQTLNFTGFRKILKKHDKVHKEHTFVDKLGLSV